MNESEIIEEYIRRFEVLLQRRRWPNCYKLIEEAKNDLEVLDNYKVTSYSPISALNLPTLIYEILDKHKYYTIRDILNVDITTIQSIHNIGPAHILIIKQKLQQHGFQWHPNGK